MPTTESSVATFHCTWRNRSWPRRRKTRPKWSMLVCTALPPLSLPLPNETERSKCAKRPISNQAKHTKPRATTNSNTNSNTQSNNKVITITMASQTTTVWLVADQRADGQEENPAITITIAITINNNTIVGSQQLWRSVRLNKKPKPHLNKCATAKK